jgi:hypothetical protein
VVDSLDANAGFALVLSEAAAMRSVRRPPLGGAAISHQASDMEQKVKG